jgi:hypothetical protein
VGAIACERHGTHPGLLTCDHVSEAVANSTPLPDLQNYRLNVSGEPLDHMLCGACAAQLGFSHGEPISDACPVCVACFLEWRNRT